MPKERDKQSIYEQNAGNERDNSIVCIESPSNSQMEWNTYSTAQSEQSVCDLWNVLLFPKVDGLEDILIWHTVGY